MISWMRNGSPPDCCATSSIAAGVNGAVVRASVSASRVASEDSSGASSMSTLTAARGRLGRSRNAVSQGLVAIASVRYARTSRMAGASAPASRSTKNAHPSMSPHCRSSIASTTRVRSASLPSSSRSAANASRRSSCESTGRFPPCGRAGSCASTGNMRVSTPKLRGTTCWSVSGSRRRRCCVKSSTRSSRPWYGTDSPS